MQLAEMREYQARYSRLIEQLGELENELLSKELSERQIGFGCHYGFKLGSMRVGLNEAIDKMTMYMVTT